MISNNLSFSNLIEEGLGKYISQINKIKMLTLEEENELVQKWCSYGDIKAAEKLVVSHLKLVVKIAFKFKRYGLPIWDLISEGSIGLMKAVKKFKPNMNCRVSTYAMWWIKASIQNYILKSWSLVKVGTSTLKNKLFSNLNKTKDKIGLNEFSKEDPLPGNFYSLSQEDNNIGAVISLNQSYGEDEMINSIQSNEKNQEEIAIDDQNNNRMVEALKIAMSELNPRELDILKKRRLNENEKNHTLGDLADLYSISKERVRQIEDRVLEKLKKRIAELTCKLNDKAI